MHVNDELILDVLLRRVKSETMRVLNDKTPIASPQSTDDPDTDAINACVLSMALLVQRHRH